MQFIFLLVLVIILKQFIVWSVIIYKAFFHNFNKSENKYMIKLLKIIKLVKDKRTAYIKKYYAGL